MITEKMKVEQYIPLHNAEYIEYCEALLFEDGEIKDAVPSHTEALINAVCEHDGITRDKLDSMIPASASVIHWIVEQLNIIAIWYNNAIVHSITNAQMDSLRLLQENGCISDKFHIKISKEKSLCEATESGNVELIIKISDERKEYDLINRRLTAL